MNNSKQWLSLENEEEYNLATARYEELKGAIQGSEAHKEKMLLVQLISGYESREWDLATLDPVETLKIRSAEFGLN